MGVDDISEISIEILDSDGGKKYGSSINEKRERLNPNINRVTSTNWQKYFADELSQDKKTQLDDGTLYLMVATDPNNGNVAGFVEVRHQFENALSVDVFESYQRRGVADALIRQAQKDHDQLHLLNFAGVAGVKLYTNMGFAPDGKQDHFVWNKSGN